MTITAAMVKELRESTGAGMMDAKKALIEVNGDMEAAVDWLRTKGLAKAAKKADRVAAEGLVGVAVSGGKGVAVEVNSETDFVGKNGDFQNLVRGITTAALGVSDVDALKTADLNGKTVSESLTDAIATIGENMTLRRMAAVEGDAVAAYIHTAAADGLGRIGVLVALKGADNGIGKQIAMHIAATSPVSLSEADMDPVVVERELAVQTAKALEENAASAKPKPDAVIHNNIIPGRMKKFFEESTLLNQKFVINPDVTVAQAAKDAGIALKQTFVKEGKQLARKAGRYAHAKQFRRMHKAIGRQRTVLGRLAREVERKIATTTAACAAVNATPIAAAVQQALSTTLERAQRIWARTASKKTAAGQKKLYAFHAPEVECIGKGKSRQPYEFGVKVGIATTLKGNLIVGAKAFAGNP